MLHKDIRELANRVQELEEENSLLRTQADILFRECNYWLEVGQFLEEGTEEKKAAVRNLQNVVRLE